MPVADKLFAGPWCPMFKEGKRCNAPLTYWSGLHSSSGTLNGVDLNHYTEIWYCDRCGAKVQRHFRWEEAMCAKKETTMKAANQLNTIEDVPRVIDEMETFGKMFPEATPEQTQYMRSVFAVYRDVAVSLIEARAERNAFMR